MLLLTEEMVDQLRYYVYETLTNERFSMSMAGFSNSFSHHHGSVENGVVFER